MNESPHAPMKVTFQYKDEYEQMQSEQRLCDSMQINTVQDGSMILILIEFVDGNPHQPMPTYGRTAVMTFTAERVDATRPN